MYKYINYIINVHCIKKTRWESPFLTECDKLINYMIIIESDAVKEKKVTTLIE